MDLILEPWPWYVSGPLIGLTLIISILIGGEPLGVSSSFRHICSACVPGDVEFFKYDWKKYIWNLLFVLGIGIGGFVATNFLNTPEKIPISEQTVADLNEIGLTDLNGFVPTEIFSFSNLLSLNGFIFMILGGLLVGFGVRFAGGCTSGHTISGISNLQWVSLVATISFFVGGLVMTHFIYPLIF
ncbi:MAG: YeeE/YedE family protein [Bacteroidia bacterium]